MLPAEPFDAEAEEMVMVDPRLGVDAWIRVDGDAALRDAVAGVWTEDMEGGMGWEFRIWIMDRKGEFLLFSCFWCLRRDEFEVGS